MDFPKKQAQRLIPSYLLEYSEKLFTNHPDPEAPWGGGGGSDYTAGQGITITNNEISVDTNVIATKSDIPSLQGYATETWVQNQGYATSSEIPTNYVTTDTAQTISGAKTFQGGLITKNTTFGIEMNIIPSRFEYTYNNQGTIERTLFDLPTDKVAGTEQEPTTYILATTNDIPTVNNPTIRFTQGGVTKGTITLNQSNDQIIAFDDGAQPDCPFLNVSDPQNQMYFSLDGSDSSWYQYIDLSAVSHQFRVNLSALNPVFKDGLTSTFNDTTNQLEVGLSAPIPDTSKFVTTDTAQEITGIKTFAHNPVNITDAGIKIDMYDAVKTKAGVEFNTYGTGDFQNWCLAGFNGALRIKQLSGTGDFAISDIGIIPKNINSANLGDSSNRWNNLYLSGNLSDGTNSVKVADIATKADIPTVPTTATSTSTLTPTTTELVFTYADNTTETITLMTAATVSTTTTLS